MKYAQLEWPTTYLVAIRILKRPTRHTLLVLVLGCESIGEFEQNRHVNNNK